MKVVIVGGAGFLGFETQRELARFGYKIVIADSARRLTRLRRDLQGCELKEFDFSSRSDAKPVLEGCDVLLHFASTSTPATSMKNISSDCERNVLGSIRLFEAAVDAGVERVIFSSSGGTIYGAASNKAIKEDYVACPMSAYGAAKLSIESYLALYDSLNGVSLRFGNPYGDYQLRGTAVGVIANYLRSLELSNPIEVWGTGEIIRDYVHVRDAISAVRSIIEADKKLQGPFNVGSGMGISINEIVQILFKVTGREVPVKHTAARTYDVPAIVLDSSRLQSAVNWKPKITIEDGIAEMWHKIT